jgi:outer membrane protein assembly factor BamD (BamD/ComL family)
MVIFCKKQRIWAVLLTFLFSACLTTVNISENLSPAELIQRAQEATDKNRYNIALQYYEALYDRNPGNIDLIITAEYEIAFIHYKQKKYNQAHNELTSILKYYDSPDEELLPQHFKRLAQIVIQKIEDKENPKAKNSNL